MEQGALEQVFMNAFSEHGDAIFRFCLLKVSDVPLAEDMTQEVFTRYWQSLREGKPMANTRSFLYTVAHNMAKDWYKKKKSDSLDARMEDGFEVASSELNPETVAAYQEVIAHINDLESGDKEVLVLRHVEGLEPKDIAEILGESANVISVRLNRAMKRLKEHVGV